MSAEVRYFFSDLYDNDIDLDNQGTSSMISALDIFLLKKAINDIDIRIHDEIIEKIWQLGSLEEGWDSYAGSPIADNAIINANLFLSKIVEEGLVFKRPTVSPEPNGGVLLKWRENKREFLVWFTPHQQNCIYVEVFSGLRTGGKVDSLDKLFVIFKKWIGECLL